MYGNRCVNWNMTEPVDNYRRNKWKNCYLSSRAGKLWPASEVSLIPKKSMIGSRTPSRVVEFRNRKSISRRVKHGVPQVGVRYPILFKFYPSKHRTPHQGCDLLTYAEDCALMAVGHINDELCGICTARDNTGRSIELFPANYRLHSSPNGRRT